MEHKNWNGFKKDVWADEINVRNFIQTNYKEYSGNDSFLAGATARTEQLMVKVQELFNLERQYGGVLDIDTATVSSLTSYSPGYIDKENEILKRCKVLKQYSNFIELVREEIASGEENPLTKAISKALKLGFLSDYLARKATEVENMLMTEYDYDTDIAVQREEAFNEGVSQGAEQKAIETARNMLNDNLSINQIVQYTGLPLEKVIELKS